MPFDLEDAYFLAHKRVEDLAQAAGDEFEILRELTVEVQQGWIFFYNTADFVRTNNFSSSLAGNGPVLVTHAGVVHELPSGIPWEEAVQKIE